MNLEPAIPFTHGGIGEATEADAKLALQNIDETCIWTFWNQEFLISYKAMVIARVEGIGTGFPYMAWAIKYINPFTMQRDWLEIKDVPLSLRESRRK